MEDYKSSSNIPELIAKIEDGKSDAVILAFIRQNMVNQQIILNNLESTHISHLIGICNKYNLKYDYRFTKKLLIINNSSHKYLNKNSSDVSTAKKWVIHFLMTIYLLIKM